VLSTAFNLLARPLKSDTSKSRNPNPETHILKLGSQKGVGSDLPETRNLNLETRNLKRERVSGVT